MNKLKFLFFFLILFFSIGFLGTKFDSIQISYKYYQYIFILTIIYSTLEFGTLIGFSVAVIISLFVAFLSSVNLNFQIAQGIPINLNFQFLLFMLIPITIGKFFDSINKELTKCQEKLSLLDKQELINKDLILKMDEKIVFFINKLNKSEDKIKTIESELEILFNADKKDKIIEADSEFILESNGEKIEKNIALKIINHININKKITFLGFNYIFYVTYMGKKIIFLIKSTETTYNNILELRIRNLLINFKL